MLLCFVLIAGTQVQAQKSNSSKKTKKEETKNPAATVQLGKTKSNSTNALKKLFNSQSSDYVITSEHVSSTSGIHHIYIRQAIDGIGVVGTESSLHIDASGKIISSHNNFVSEINGTVKNASASISASQAITSVAQQMGYTINNLQVVKISKERNQKTVFTTAGISKSEISVTSLFYFQKGKGTTRIWELSIQEINSSDWWNFRVDASTGQIIDKDNWTLSCNILGDHSLHSHNTSEKNTVFFTAEEKPSEEENSILAGSYNVYAIPVESPNHGGRTLVSNPDDPTASPYGWHDTNGIAGAEFTNTRGNNVNAYEDGDNVGFSPNGGASLIFNFPINTTYSAGNQSESAAITNLFYWNNIIHDVMYQHGFDEASGNFQENNYGNGGAGSDSVNAEAQDGSGTCNANFGTPADGANPTMQMFVCGSRDGDLDNVVIVHEYGHGISNRLTGGPAASSCLNNTEQMGEGWSDYIGLVMTIEPGDTRTDSRGVGTWLIGEGANGPGIRTYPYSTDFAVNPHTYDDIKTEVIPHGVGSVWAAMLWEMTWDLIAVYGVDSDIYGGTGGNNVALTLVTEGMKLQPCSPGFIDGRDAILAADNAIYGGANQCIIWEAFARRGLGFSASQGSTASRSDGVEAFDLPPGTAVFTNSINNICVTEGVQNGLGGGIPTGGTYSGTGVTDDGNGTTYTFDPAVAGVGTATITYNVVDSCSGGPVSLNDTIEVSDGLPVLVCQDATLTLDGGGNASITWPDVVANSIPAGYSYETITYAPVTITGAATSVSLGDDSGTAAIPLGFNFDFYGITYTNFYIASNGFVSFTGNGMSGTASYQPTAIPNAAVPNGMIALVWDDLSPNIGGTIQYEIFGTAPNRRMVIEYNLVPLYNDPATVSVQAHLYEGTNVIEIHFIDAQNNGGNRTFGIENETGTEALTDPAGNLGNWTASNFSAAFTPQPDSFADNCGNPVTISLSNSNFSCKDIGDNIITITADDGNGGIATCTATVTVVGPTSTYSIGTWDVAPNSGRKVLFNDNYDTGTSGSIDACSCEINVGNTVTVGAGDYLKVEGNITNNGTLTIEHEGSLVQVDDNATVTNNGNINVIKTTPVATGDSFSILGSPMSLTTRGGAFVDNNVVMYHSTAQFNLDPTVTAVNAGAEHFADAEGDNWNFILASTPTTQTFPVEGYLVGPTTASVGSGSYNLTYNEGTLNNGVYSFTAIYNLVGTAAENKSNSPNILSNPYASAIDADALITNNVVIDEIYFWEHLTAPAPNGDGTGGTYPGYRFENWNMGDISIRNAGGGIAAPNGGVSPTQFIPSGQGFAIKANAAGTVTFNNSLRVTGNNTGYRNTEIERMYVNISNETYALKSSALVVFTNGATNGYEAMYDTKRLATPVSIYSVLDENELAIQGRSVFTTDQVIPFGFRTMVEENQNYTISLGEIEGANLSTATVYLEDNLLGIITNLSEYNYTFTSNESNQKDRFVIVFGEEQLGNTDVNIESISLYPNPTSDILNIVSPQIDITSVEVYDVRGRMISTVNVENNATYKLNMGGLESAMYFVKINTENGTITKRVIRE